MISLSLPHLIISTSLSLASMGACRGTGSPNVMTVEFNLFHAQSVGVLVCVLFVFPSWDWLVEHTKQKQLREGSSQKQHTYRHTLELLVVSQFPSVHVMSGPLETFSLDWCQAVLHIRASVQTCFCLQTPVTGTSFKISLPRGDHRQRFPSEADQTYRRGSLKLSALVYII